MRETHKRELEKLTIAHPAALGKPFIPANRITYKHPYITAMMLQMSESRAPKHVGASEDA
jgi:hypothetical protein